MRRLNLVVRATYAAVAAGIAVGLLGGCYGTVRTRFPDDDGGGVGGRGGSSGGASGDAGVDGGPTGCSPTCPGPSTGPTTGTGACVNDECRISCNGAFPTLCAASNACVDLTNDGKNCGACGHDCLAGACAASQCQPALIAQYTGHPMMIYVGTEAVYLTTDLGYVGRARKDGTDLKPVAVPGFASSAFAQTLLAEDSDRVFFARNAERATQLSYCLTSGCDSTAASVGGDYTQYFAVDQANHKLFWVDYSPSRLMSASTLGVVSPAAIPGGSLASGSSGSRLLYAQGGIFFVDGNNVSRIAATGGPIATVTSSPDPLSLLGANSATLFVYDGGVIGSMPLPNGNGRRPDPVITTSVNTSPAGHFAADDTAIYWVGGGLASVCQISNCSGTLKALPKRKDDAIQDVAIDAAAIYFAADGVDQSNRVVSTIWKLAK